MRRMILALLLAAVGGCGNISAPRTIDGRYTGGLWTDDVQWSRAQFARVDLVIVVDKGAITATLRYLPPYSGTPEHYTGTIDKRGSLSMSAALGDGMERRITGRIRGTELAASHAVWLGDAAFHRGDLNCWRVE